MFGYLSKKNRRMFHYLLRFSVIVCKRIEEHIVFLRKRIVEYSAIFCKELSNVRLSFAKESSNVQLSFAKESSNVCSVIVCKRIVKCLFGYRLQKNHQMFVRLSFAKESSNIRLSFPPLDILWKEASSQIVPVILNRRKK
jgi:hypothetical protein